MSKDDLRIAGDVEEGYGKVADAFRRNFNEYGEIGAACAVYEDNRPVVDLWGGFRDARIDAPWGSDTLVYWASATKGMASMALLVAHSRGLLDFDQPVALYWPEFAQNGKESITLRQLMSHQSGLAALDQKLDLAMAADLDARAVLLAAQRPLWPPGSRQGYHAWTFGWCESEVLRRVDTQGRSLGQFFADEVATPLGIEFYIGLPDEIQPHRVAAVQLKTSDVLRVLPRMPWRFFTAMLNPRSLTSRAIRVLPGPPVGSIEDERIRAYVRIEFYSGYGIGQARGVARAYGELATGGEQLGITRETLQLVQSSPTPPSAGFYDLVAHTTNLAFSLGFVRPVPGQWFGSPSGRTFGHHGGGGCGGFADADLGVGFAYAPNRLSLFDMGMRGDPRKDALIDALYEALGESQVPSSRSG
jgi:CubicO group peptidase (beta-lactamase class C family)